MQNWDIRKSLFNTILSLTKIVILQCVFWHDIAFYQSNKKPTGGLLLLAAATRSKTERKALQMSESIAPSAL